MSTTAEPGLVLTVGRQGSQKTKLLGEHCYSAPVPGRGWRDGGPDTLLLVLIFLVMVYGLHIYYVLQYSRYWYHTVWPCNNNHSQSFSVSLPLYSIYINLL